MEKQTAKLDQALKVSGILGILIIALSISYYLLVFLPQKQQEQDRIDKVRSHNLDFCLNNAESSYDSYLQYATKYKQTECTGYYASSCKDSMDKEIEVARQHYVQGKEECIKRYPPV